MTEPTNRGLQVAGQNGAATTESRYGKEFLLAKIREKQGIREECEALRDEGSRFLDDMDIEPVAPATPSMRQILGPGGVIASHLPGYEVREPQLQMAELVAKAIDDGEHCLCEAGTGTGKSLAYLIPAIYSGKKAVVSTGDKGLQDQLWRKDVPFLQGILPIPFTAAILKGRGNYLCIEKWNEEIGQQVFFGESYEFAQVREWLQETKSGDLEEMSITLSPDLSSKVTCSSDQCLGKHCPSLANCYAERAHALAESAQIVIVNHTLLTLDASIRANSDGFAKVIPDRDLVIVDEAHRLEDAATLAFQEEISTTGISRLIRDKKVQRAALDAELISAIDAAAQMLFDTLARLNQSLSYSLDTPSASIKALAQSLSLKLSDAARELKRSNPFAIEGGPQQESYRKHVERVEAYAKLVTDILFPADGYVIYVEKRQGKSRQLVYLRRCPICVAEPLRQSLFAEWPVVCTSATLSTNGSFAYFKDRCGCDSQSSYELSVGSPFNYPRNMLIYVPKAGSLLDPSKYYQDGSEAYFDRLAEQIESLLLASDGRAFCLFTSNRALNAVYDRIADRLRWLVLKQGQAPRPELLRQFKENGQAVLFGLRSFWEGIDVQGNALSLVIIDKMPFGMPDDPIYDARCKEVVKRTGDKWAWFNLLAVPNATLTLKQGVGRLIRTRNDIGTVALLDERLVTKRYGWGVLNSLPPGRKTHSIENVKAFFEARRAE
jgi:Rad3-related DNA helicase